MKNNKPLLKYLKIATLLILTSGCNSSLLDMSPSNEISSENIWRNSNLATLAVTGVYNQLRANYTTNNQNNPTWDVRSSIVDYDANWIGSLPLLRGTATPQTGEYLTFWKRHYEAIHRANDVIANIHKVPDMPSAKKAQYIAECKFLRAFFYYRLNTLWKGVPIYLTPIQVSEANRPRATEDQVWQIILSDLSDCIQEQNLPNKYNAASSDYGRITKSAAYALRGKVYMWKENYEKAKEDFTAVTRMGHTLFSNYKTLFKVQNERSDEMIFSIQFIEQAGYGSSLSWAFGNRGTAGAGWNNYIPNPSLVDSYETIDGKPFNWNDFLPGYTNMTTRQRSVYFLRNNMTSDEISTMTTYGADMTKYLPNGNEQRIKAVYNNRDPRLNLNIITPYSTYLGGITGSEVLYTLRWPYRGADNAEPYDLRTDANSKFYYLIRKFVFEGREHLNQTFSPIDIPLIRYADVLISLAEAKNELGELNSAIQDINLVRTRAGVQLLNTNSFTRVIDKEDMRERIRKERYWELPFEEHMYFDELRWKTWKDKKFRPGNGLTEIWGTTTYTYSWVGDQNWTWPIPSTEIEMNKSLVQNPGWTN